MINPIVEKSIEILKKIRLLNIEKDNLFNSNYSAWEKYYKSTVEELLQKKTAVSDEKKVIEDKINSVIKSLEELDNSHNKKKSELEDAELVDLKIGVFKKEIDEYKIVLDEKLSELNTIEKELQNYEKTFSIYQKSSKIEDDEKNDKIIEICRSINYMKDLLNKDIVSRYDIIERNFKSRMMRYVVANIVGGFCENCNISVPLYKEDQISNKTDFVMCENCGCFLVDFTE